MEQSTNTQLIHSIFQFKKLVGSGFGMDLAANKSDINISELLLMNGLADNTDNPEGNVSLTEIGRYLAVSKGAVSQMLGSLEKKGYINREIDRSNRRNLIVTLTPKGREVLEQQYRIFNCKLERIIGQLGEDDVEQMIRIVNRMIAITGEINEESEKERS